MATISVQLLFKLPSGALPARACFDPLPGGCRGTVCDQELNGDYTLPAPLPLGLNTDRGNSEVQRFKEEESES